MKKFRLRSLGLLLISACVLLTTQACHRRTVVKYGGPPADYKSMKTPSTKDLQPVKKV